MPNAAAKRANKPSETRWPADDLEVGLEELAEVGTGVPVATAPTPPVTGPWSEIWKSSKVWVSTRNACVANEQPTAGSFEPRAFAASMYASNVFPLAGGLIALRETSPIHDVKKTRI